MYIPGRDYVRYIEYLDLDVLISWVNTVWVDGHCRVGFEYPVTNHLLLSPIIDITVIGYRYRTGRAAGYKSSELVGLHCCSHR